MRRTNGSSMSAKKYDSTVARIAGNLLSGVAAKSGYPFAIPPAAIEQSVVAARAIVAEVARTEPAACGENER